MFTFLIGRARWCAACGSGRTGCWLGCAVRRRQGRGARPRAPAEGPALIAAKHQAMVDTLAPFTFVDDVCFVLKEELTKLPLFGWYCVAAQMIASTAAATPRR
jgi:1-acyl-sn-glycerol-3-phosphate acyltransferase